MWPIQRQAVETRQRNIYLPADRHSISYPGVGNSGMVPRLIPLLFDNYQIEVFVFNKFVVIFVSYFLAGFVIIEIFIGAWVHSCEVIMLD